MSRLKELIKELCPNGVVLCPLCDVSIIRNGRDYKGFQTGDVPVYGSGGVMTYIDTAIYNKPSVLIPRKGSLNNLFYVDEPFWNVDTIFYTEINAGKIIPKYLYYCLKREHLEELNTAGGVPSLTQTILNKVLIPVPPLEVQREIVRILDDYTEQTEKLKAELASELTARKKQYEYYRDQLLNFGKIEGVEALRVKLGDIVKIKNGKDYKHLGEGPYPVYGSGGVMTRVDSYVYDKPSVLIPRKGSIGNLFYTDGPFWNVDTIFYTEINTEVVFPKFLFYALQKEHLESLNTAGGVPSLTQAVLNEVILDLPKIEIQKRIANTLDNFDAICSDLNIGLPAEIEARKLQYEYYRDLLLSFGSQFVHVERERGHARA